MKQKTLAISTASIIVSIISTSCSSDENNPNPSPESDAKLLKQIQTEPAGSQAENLRVPISIGIREKDKTSN